MTNPKESIRVVFIGDPGSAQQQITAAFTSQKEFVLSDIISSMARLFRDLRAAEPDVVLVDHVLGEQPTLDIIDDITLQLPDAAVIAILPENDPLSIQQVTLAGARAFLVQPFTQVNLLSTLRRVRELESRREKFQASAAAAAKTGESKTLHTLAVYSPRGGVGCSTVAVNLAISMLEQTGASVLLLDGKLFFGHLDVMLNIRARNTLADLIPHSTTMEETLVREIVIEHSSGINVLLAPSDMQLAQGIRPDDLYNVYIGLKRFYDYIIIDAGSSLSENTVTLMDAADRVLLVTAPDLAALHDTSRFIQVSRSLAYPADKVLVLLNRVGIPGGIKPRDIETALRHNLYAQVPDDGPECLRSINRGIPLVVRYPRSPASRALQQLAKNLLTLSATEGLAEPVSPAMNKSQKDALMASSQLG